MNKLDNKNVLPSFQFGNVVTFSKVDGEYPSSGSCYYYVYAYYLDPKAGTKDGCLASRHR